MVSDLKPGADAPKAGSQYFSTKALHSRFPECTVPSNSVKLSNTNGIYAHKASLEREFLFGRTAGNTCYFFKAIIMKKNWLELMELTIELFMLLHRKL